MARQNRYVLNASANVNLNSYIENLKTPQTSVNHSTLSWVDYQNRRIEKDMEKSNNNL